MLFVSTVRLFLPVRWRVASSTVVPMSMAIVSPSLMSSAVFLAMRRFSSILSASRVVYMGSADVMEFSTAPPYTRLKRFCSSSALRSRRIVSIETFSSRFSSSIVIFLWTSNNFMILSCLSSITPISPCHCCKKYSTVTKKSQYILIKLLLLLG